MLHTRTTKTLRQIFPISIPPLFLTLPPTTHLFHKTRPLRTKMSDLPTTYPGKLSLLSHPLLPISPH